MCACGLFVIQSVAVSQLATLLSRDHCRVSGNTTNYFSGHRRRHMHRLLVVDVNFISFFQGCRLHRWRNPTNCLLRRNTYKRILAYVIVVVYFILFFSHLYVVSVTGSAHWATPIAQWTDSLRALSSISCYTVVEYS